MRYRSSRLNAKWKKRSVGKRKFDLTLANMRVSWKFYQRLIASSFSHPQLLSADCAYPLLSILHAWAEREWGKGGKAYKNTQNHILHFLRVVVVSSFPHSCVWQQDDTKAEALNVAMCGCECVSLDFLILNVLWNLLPFLCCLCLPSSTNKLDSSRQAPLSWLGTRYSLSLFQF